MVAGSLYPVTTETELVTQASRPRSTTNAPLWYLIYNSLLIALSILAIAFWGFSAHAPLLYSFHLGQWLLANPKKSTIIWTACGTIVAAILLFLLNSVLFLMVRQKARVGSTLSTIEGRVSSCTQLTYGFLTMLLLGWNKCANQKPLLDIKRPWLSGFTTVNWVIALLLTTAFTTLLTPTRVLVSDYLVGDELDFTAPEFWQWYNTFDSKGIPRRKVYGCTRYTYNSSTGSIRFPTCPIADDPIAVVSAGVSAAQESFGVRNASVRVVESLFKGSTGGVLPLELEGISAFSNVKFMSWDLSMAKRSQQFNYPLTQQGLSAEVTCQETPNTPIQTQLLKSMEVTNSNAGGTMELRRFIVNRGNCGSNHTFVVPGIGAVAPGFCQPDATVKKYVLYLTPMGRYSRAPVSLPNMTCTFEPMITKNIVVFSTDTGLFTSSVMERMGGSGIPNETADAINSLFMISTTSWVRLHSLRLDFACLDGFSNVCIHKTGKRVDRFDAQSEHEWRWFRQLFMLAQCFAYCSSPDRLHPSCGMVVHLDWVKDGIINR